jgi:hypothetical protein
MDPAIAVWGLVTSLRLLRTHLFTALYMQLPETSTGLTSEVKTSIYGNLQKLLALTTTGKCEEKVIQEASLTLIHTFEVFYSTQSEKLDYLIEALTNMKDKKEYDSAHMNIQRLLFQKMSTPLNFSMTFEAENEEIPAKL